MRRRTKGQSLVEMALLLPLLLLILFGIIDFGWYVYGYATVYIASRSGAEEATMAPPQPAKSSDPTDQCTGSIYKEIQGRAPLFSDLAKPANVTITYPSGTRAAGEPVEVKITYDIKALTPLWRLASFNSSSNGTFKASVTTRRTIEVVGNSPNSRRAPNQLACG